MQDLVDKLAQLNALIVVVGALGFVAMIAAVALAGPQLARLFQGLPF